MLTAQHTFRGEAAWMRKREQSKSIFSFFYGCSCWRQLPVKGVMVLSRYSSGASDDWARLRSILWTVQGISGWMWEEVCLPRTPRHVWIVFWVWVRDTDMLQGMASTCRVTEEDKTWKARRDAVLRDADSKGMLQKAFWWFSMHKASARNQGF